MEVQCDFHSVFMKSGSVNDYLGHRQQGSSFNQMDKFLSCHHWAACVICYLMAHEWNFKAVTSWFNEAESDSVCFKVVSMMTTQRAWKFAPAAD